jgi:hypothetical protein
MQPIHLNIEIGKVEPEGLADIHVNEVNVGNYDTNTNILYISDEELAPYEVAKAVASATSKLVQKRFGRTPTIDISS